MDNSEINFEYSSLLSPPEGYVLGKAIGTTYSLDLRTALSIPLAFHFRTGIDPELITDPFALFLSLKSTASKIDIFCQLGCINPDVSDNKLFRFIENSINEISLENGKSFHPKIWIIRYEKLNSPSIYRVINLTRNMTMDRSWDMVIAMEGEVNPEGTVIDSKKNEPLIDFIKYLYQKSEKSIPVKFLSELDKVCFRPLKDEYYTNIEFLPLGIGRQAKSLDIAVSEFNDDPYDQVIIVSPFVSQNKLDHISSNTVKTTLISRLNTLEELDQKKLNLIDCFYINEKVVSGGTSVLDEELEVENKKENNNPSDKNIPVFDLHAKIYFVKHHSQYYLAIGSANATESAFNGNIEFMIRIDGERRNSAEYFVETYFKQSNDFLVKYIPDPTKQKIIDDSAEKLIDNYLAKLCVDFSKTKFICILQEDGLYTVKSKSEVKNINNPEFEVYLRPLSIDESYQSRIAENLIFRNIILKDLSVLFVLSVNHPLSGLKRSSIIKLNIENLPDEREEAVVRSLIDNKAALFRLLRLLLSDDLIDALLEGGINDNPNKEGSSWNYSSADEFAIFEKMMVASSRNPSKLNEVNTIIQYLENNNSSKAIEDMDIKKFVEFWSNFKTVIKN